MWLRRTDSRASRIRVILDRPDFDRLDALEEHKLRVEAEAYAGLADLYLSHPDFRTRYETLAPGFCDYLAAAMKAYAQRLRAAGGPEGPRD